MHSRVFAVAIILGLLAGCASSEGNSDETADLPVESSPLRCPSSGTSRCAYLAPGLPIESRVVGERRENSPPIGDEDMHERVPQLAEVPHATFEGMWDYDPEEEGYAFDLCGYLIIEEPYIHVLATETGYRPLPTDMHQELPRRGDGDLLYFMLMLPRAQTRYDPGTRSLWVHEDGPFIDGDHVSAVGVRGAAADLDGNSVHERLPWRTMSMLRAEDEFGCNDSPRTRADSAAGTVPSPAEVPHATFEGMWDDDPDGDGHSAALCGYLIIEEPYVHVLQTEREWGHEVDPGLARSEDGSLLYAMIMLPRPGTRYDPETRSLWVYGEGPMTDGDHVLVGGGEGYRQPDWPGPNVHQRLLWQANGMGPADYPC